MHYLSKPDGIIMMYFSPSCLNSNHVLFSSVRSVNNTHIVSSLLQLYNSLTWFCNCLPMWMTSLLDKDW